MKIAVWHNTMSGGARRALYHCVKGLIERGHTVESWCPSTADQSYLPIRILTTEHIVPFEQSFNGSRRLGGRYLNAFARMRAMDKACEQSAREIRSGNFDVLFATSCIYYSMPFIARHLDMPKVVYLHEPSRRLYEAFPSLPWVGKVLNRSASLRARMCNFVFDQVEMQCLRIQARRDWLNANSCDEMLVNSYYSRENIVRTYGRGAKVCYPGIDTSLFRNLKKPRENFIAGLGAYVATKGIDLALKSIALLDKPRPKLVWISNGGAQSYLEEMIRLADSLGVEFELKKLIRDAEVVDILNRAALLIYTSQLEPFGLAPLEANACGAPVVAVAEGGVRETIKDGVNGLLVDRDPESVSEAVNKLLRDPQLARRIGERASDHVRREWGVVASVERLENHLMRAARSPLAQKSVAYSAR